MQTELVCLQVYAFSEGSMTGLQMAGSLKAAQAEAQPAGRGFQAACSAMELEVDGNCTKFFVKIRAATYLYKRRFSRRAPQWLSTTKPKSGWNESPKIPAKSLNPRIFVPEVNGLHSAA